MKWKQFFTPVHSIDWEEAHRLIQDKGQVSVMLLDVRQVNEYRRGHLPGAKLLPVGELDQRLSELDLKQHIIIY